MNDCNSCKLAKWDDTPDYWGEIHGECLALLPACSLSNKDGDFKGELIKPYPCKNCDCWVLKENNGL